MSDTDDLRRARDGGIDQLATVREDFIALRLAPSIDPGTEFDLICMVVRACARQWAGLVVSPETDTPARIASQAGEGTAGDFPDVACPPMPARDAVVLMASSDACYKWPDDTDEHKALRQAYIDGAQAMVGADLSALAPASDPAKVPEPGPAIQRYGVHLLANGVVTMQFQDGGKWVLYDDVADLTAKVAALEADRAAVQRERDEARAERDIAWETNRTHRLARELLGAGNARLLKRAVAAEAELTAVRGRMAEAIAAASSTDTIGKRRRDAIADTLALGRSAGLPGEDKDGGAT